MSTQNYGDLFGVVIRQSQHNRPVVSAIINKSEDKDVDDQIHYLLSKGEEHMVEFKNTFVEFKRANWYIDITEYGTNKIVHSEEFRANPPWNP